MSDKELSQSELARRVGISQASIHKLLSGRAYGSKHLHRIARELSTTPAYLTGETDDPDADGPPAPELDSETRELVDNFTDLSPADRRALLQVARSMKANRAASGTVQAPASDFRGEPSPEGAATPKGK